MEQTDAFTPSKAKRAVSRQLRVTLWVLVTGAFTLGVGWVWLDWHPIDRHRLGLLLAVHKPTRAFTWDYLLWNLQGRRSIPDIVEARREHLNALADLGYLEGEKFYLQNVRLEGDVLRRFFAFKNSWLDDGRLPDEVGWVAMPMPSVLEVVVKPEMLPIWRKMVREFDDAGGKVAITLR